MPRTREQFAAMKTERKATILSTALPLFSLGQKVTVDLITEKAKCSHGIFYHYFKNTDQILDALLKSSTYIELKKSLFPQEGSNYEKIQEILSILLDVSKETFEKVCFLNIIIKDREKTSLYAQLIKLVKEGQTAGSIIGGEPAQLVDSIFLLLKGLYLTFLLEKRPDTKAPSVETVMQLLRKPTTFSRQIL